MKGPIPAEVLADTATLYTVYGERDVRVYEVSEVDKNTTSLILLLTTRSV